MHSLVSRRLTLRQEQPKKVAVIGAGYIAVELAGVFQSLGTDTTLLVRRDTPIRSFDSLLVETLVSEMDKSGLTLKPHATTKVSGEVHVDTRHDLIDPAARFLLRI